MELWGGVECTINRVGNQWRSQFELSGHASRLSDLKLIRNLGIRTLRYPILWESTAPKETQLPNFAWANERLTEMRRLGIKPIVGLLHHGSGPSYTDLLDPKFATKFASYALQVAERFPWLESFSPINEPLTTARFSALYGHWYPHHRSDVSFSRALINQCRGIVLAMQAIRLFAPRAALVQTEDLGTTYSTSHMKYQCEFDNTRRWLTWDLLCGRVDRTHPMHAFLTANGIGCGELEWFLEWPCPPQILGINHYVTSDRYLDERLGHYATDFVGQNAVESYADIEAVRSPHRHYQGWRIIAEAWNRYRLPVAVTEVHIGCTREEQLRWFSGAWRAATAARATGCDVKAVTAWSLFGSFDWNSLLTRNTGYYEPGAYDIRAPVPRPTALAELLQGISSTGRPSHPAAVGQGWWDRHAVRNHASRNRRSAEPETVIGTSGVILCGRSKSMGAAFIQACRERNICLEVLGFSDLKSCSHSSVERLIDRMHPWAIIYLAEIDGDVALTSAEWQDAFYHIPTALTRLAERHEMAFLTISSDAVFNGATREPYVETRATSPEDMEGYHQLALEQATLAYQYGLCVRTSLQFCDIGGKCGLSAHPAAATHDRSSASVSKTLLSPTYLPDLIHASLDLLIDRTRGLVHLANRGAISWPEFARRVIELAPAGAGAGEESLFTPTKLARWRTGYRVLESSRVLIMPTLEDALQRFSADWSRSLQGSLKAVSL